jgi:hypothetical protein
MSLIREKEPPHIFSSWICGGENSKPLKYTFQLEMRHEPFNFSFYCVHNKALYGIEKNAHHKCDLTAHTHTCSLILLFIILNVTYMHASQTRRERKERERDVCVCE